MRSLRPASRVARLVLAATGVAVLTGAVGCAPQEETPAAAPSGSSSPACGKDSLATLAKGKLTIGTDKPAYSPWFVDDTPSNGKGFESAVAYAVAQKLGFAPADVVWTIATFDSAIQPGKKPFDVDVNQVSITDERKKNIDFSSGYYDVTQAVVSTKTSKIAGAKTLADLKGAKLGAQVGTTSYATITDLIKPDAAPAVFNKNDDAKLALGNGTVDGIVVDLPTALYLAAAEIDGGIVVGQFENSGGTPEQFGLVLDKGSPLTGCVTQAVDALRADGTLKQLETTWLTDTAGAPVLK